MLLALLRKYLAKMASGGKEVARPPTPIAVDRGRALSIYVHSYGSNQVSPDNFPDRIRPSRDADSHIIIAFDYAAQEDSQDCYEHAHISIRAFGFLKKITQVAIPADKLSSTRHCLLHDIYQAINKMPKRQNHKIIKILLAMYYQELFGRLTPPE